MSRSVFIQQAATRINLLVVEQEINRIKDVSVMYRYIRIYIPFCFLLALLISGATLLDHPVKTHAQDTPVVFPIQPWQPPTYNYGKVYAGNYFSPNAGVTLTLTYPPVGTITVCTTTTDKKGHFRCRIRHMPSIPYNTTATLTAADVNKLQATTPVTELPSIADYPNTGWIDRTVHVSGGGFGSSETVDVIFNLAPSPVLVATPISSGTGVFSATFKVPPSATLGGTNDGIEGKGVTSGADAYATFIVLPYVHIAPTSGPSGTSITVKGRYFNANDQVTISWYDTVTHEQIDLLYLQASSKGSFKTSVVAPQGLVVGRRYYVGAYDPQNEGNFGVFTATE